MKATMTHHNSSSLPIGQWAGKGQTRHCSSSAEFGCCWHSRGRTSLFRISYRNCSRQWRSTPAWSPAGSRGRQWFSIKFTEITRANYWFEYFVPIYLDTVLSVAVAVHSLNAVSLDEFLRLATSSLILCCKRKGTLLLQWKTLKKKLMKWKICTLH